ncbi:hypothetical protein [Streptomyces sp. NPDC090022]
MGESGQFLLLEARAFAQDFDHLAQGPEEVGGAVDLHGAFRLFFAV